MTRTLGLGAVVALAAASGCGDRPAPEPEALSAAVHRTVEEVAPGLSYTALTASGGSGGAPWSGHLLTVDLTIHRLDVVLAMDQITGQETTSSVVERSGALAGVNGGFSVSNDPWSLIHGDPAGFVVVDGVPVSEPVAGRPGLAFCDGEAHQEIRIVEPRLAVTVGDGPAGLNRAREADDVVVYQPIWGRSTLTAPGGVEVVVRDGRVAAVSTSGSTPIPDDALVVSASGRRAGALEGLAPGDVLAVGVEVQGPDGAPLDLAGCDVTSAGPLVAEGGVVHTTFDPAAYRESFVTERHPRTAVGVEPGGTVVHLLVVDGRAEGFSVGATLREMADLLRNEGADRVYNLDGGGSTTMALTGRGVVNRPSDGVERRRCDVVVVRPREAGGRL